MITRQQSLWLKGVLALSVLVHHLLLNIEFVDYFAGNRFIRLLAGQLVAGLGTVSVSGFFFLAGYGLRVSYMQKGYGYICALPKKGLSQ